MLGRPVGGQCRVVVHHGLGEKGMLLQRAGPHLLVVRLGLKPQADLTPNTQAQVGQLRVVDGHRDRMMHLKVGQAR